MQAMVPPAGVAADLSHIEFPAQVTGVAMDTSKPPVDQLQEALTGADLVLVPAGMPRKPGMTRDDLFAINAGIAKGIVEACAKYCPNAVLGLIVNPVNSVVPAMAELYKSKGLDPRKVCGVTTLDVVRANKFVSEITGADVTKVDVPVVGGHAGATILPLLSQVSGSGPVPADKIPDLDVRIQDAGTEVVSGLSGEPATLAVYVPLLGDDKKTVGTDLDYFATKVTFGKTGVEKLHPVGSLSAHEAERMKVVTEQLGAEIKKGVEFAAGN